MWGVIDMQDALQPMTDEELMISGLEKVGTPDSSMSDRELLPFLLANATIKSSELDTQHYEPFVMNESMENLFRDIKLTLELGGIVALVGPPGSGKSAAAREIARQVLSTLLANRIPIPLNDMEIQVLPGIIEKTVSEDTSIEDLFGRFAFDKVIHGQVGETLIEKAQAYEIGPVLRAALTGSILIIHEFNRLSEEAQNAFLSLFEMPPASETTPGAYRTLHIPGWEGPVRVHPQFCVILCMNEKDLHGIHPLSQANLSRIWGWVQFSYPERDFLHKILAAQVPDLQQIPKWVVQATLDIMEILYTRGQELRSSPGIRQPIQLLRQIHKHIAEGDRMTPEGFRSLVLTTFAKNIRLPSGDDSFTYLESIVNEVLEKQRQQQKQTKGKKPK